MAITYDKMLLYVKELLAQFDSNFNSNKDKIKYNRFQHTQRVLRFANRIYDALSLEEQDKMDHDALTIATIFHDSGYGQSAGREHALASEKICREFLTDMKYDSEKIEFICYLIKNHSNKSLLDSRDVPLELTVLLEADLLDDTGAHGIVMDIWIEAYNQDATFESMLEHIKRFSLPQMKHNPMKTEPARCLWESKKELTEEFVRQYERDLEI